MIRPRDEKNSDWKALGHFQTRIGVTAGNAILASIRSLIGCILMRLDCSYRAKCRPALLLLERWHILYLFQLSDLAFPQGSSPFPDQSLNNYLATVTISVWRFLISCHRSHWCVTRTLFKSSESKTQIKRRTTVAVLDSVMKPCGFKVDAPNGRRSDASNLVHLGS